ncbi:MAG: hypothetical protein NXH73_08290 [Flavobacteriaceae bacterium]|nr:hypothetical protein [Flavobacteriaceae bacterium]
MRTLLIFSMTLCSFIFTSCEFTETLVLNADGSGEMKVQMDASAMIAMMSSMGNEEENAKMNDKIDTTFYFRDILADKKDSIATLPIEQQERLKKLEAYGVHVSMDTEAEKMVYDIFINFNSINEADNLFDAFNQINNTGVNSTSETEQSPSQESVKVRYSFENNVFKRDAYIADVELHKAEMDSLKGMEMMLGGTLYKLNYTFPKKIKSTTQEDATFSGDRKTLFYQVEYLDYLKNPDLMDIEVVLEK